MTERPAQNVQKAELDAFYLDVATPFDMNGAQITDAPHGATKDDGDLSQAYGIVRSVFDEGISLDAFHDIHLNAALQLGQPALDKFDTTFLKAHALYNMALRGCGQAKQRLFDEVEERKKVEEDLRRAALELARKRDALDDLVAQRTGELLSQYEEMKRLNNRLRQTNQEQAEFTYAISHDLMSPLNTISMMLSFLEEDMLGEAQPHVMEPLNAARTTAARMHKIVEDILGYSRAIGQEITVEPVDLNALFQDILCDLKGDLKARDATVNLDPLPIFSGSKIQLRLLFQNVLSNALKFCHPGRAPVVTIAARPTCSAVLEIAMSDNGIGIDEKHFDRIFGLFQRLHTFEEYEGTGLGLTLCKRIAGNHGGEIHVTSTPGVGTTFVIRLQANAKN